MEKMTLTTEETTRYWRFSEDEFRKEIATRAKHKATALKCDVLVYDADGIAVDRARYSEEP